MLHALPPRSPLLTSWTPSSSRPSSAQQGQQQTARQPGASRQLGPSTQQQQAVGGSKRQATSPLAGSTRQRSRLSRRLARGMAAAATGGTSNGAEEQQVVILGGVIVGCAAAHCVVPVSPELAGAGIVGASIAYFLTQRGVKPLVIERTAVAAAASGKAGGFLARSWGDGGPTQALHHLSFDLHEDLAVKLGVNSYRRIPTLSVAGGPKRRAGLKPPASWLDGEVTRAQMMDSNTAQVIPHELTTKLMEAALAGGAQLRIATVTGIDTAAAGAQREQRQVTAVRLAQPGSGPGGDGGGAGADEVVPASQVVVAMGPWSVLAEDWLGGGLRIPMEGVKSTSLVYNSERVRQRVLAEPYALFCAEDANGCHMEVYPRHNGEVYICGCGGSDYVSGARLRAGGDCEHQGLVQADPRRVKAASTSFAGLTTLGRDVDSGAVGPPDISQACMRPCASDALPIMGEVPGVSGAYLACGHNCWGILWGPITGLAMSELLVDGESSCVDLRAFSPARFMASQARGTRGRHAGQVAVGEQW